MNSTELNGILKFLRNAEQLKDTIRSAFTSNGRNESTAEHTWRLCLMVLVLGKYYPEINLLRLLKICIIHDLGEAINGDISAVNQVFGVDKGIEERKDLKTLITPLSSDLQNEILSLWDEYENASSSEALLAKAFDKIETLLQHSQGKNHENIDYRFNLNYGKEYTNFDEITSYLRATIDKDTRRRLVEMDGTIKIN